MNDLKFAYRQLRKNPGFYLPQAFCFWNGGSLVVRARGELSSLAGPIRREILALDSEQPVANIRPMTQVVADSTNGRQLTLRLLGFLAGAALLLVAIGLYGMMAYTVTLRVPEIGIRMALGARPTDVFKLIVQRGIGLTLLGIGIGVAGGVSLTRVLGTQLYGVKAANPTTSAGVGLLLLVVALLACWLPARRAAKVDPLVALRTE
jgi:putative ABC transport system permease protein